MKHGDKAITRLRMRQEAFESLPEYLRQGMHRPGSLKKSHPTTSVIQYSHGRARERTRRRDVGSAKRVA